MIELAHRYSDNGGPIVLAVEYTILLRPSMNKTAQEFSPHTKHFSCSKDNIETCSMGSYTSAQAKMLEVHAI